MLNCNVCSHRNAAFFLNEIWRESTCSSETFGIGKTFSINMPENSNAQCAQIMLLFNCSHTTVTDFHSALPSPIASHWRSNNCTHSNDRPPVRVLPWSQRSAKAMVLKWPYAFQISRFSKDVIATCMAIPIKLSCLSMFAKRMGAPQNKLLLMCSAALHSESSLCSSPPSYSHTGRCSSHSLLTLLLYDICPLFPVKRFIHPLWCLLR